MPTVCNLWENRRPEAAFLFPLPRTVQPTATGMRRDAQYVLVCSSFPEENRAKYETLDLHEFGALVEELREDLQHEAKQWVLKKLPSSDCLKIWS